MDGFSLIDRSLADSFDEGIRQRRPLSGVVPSPSPVGIVVPRVEDERDENWFSVSYKK